MASSVVDAQYEINSSSRDGLVWTPNKTLVMISPDTSTNFRVWESTGRATWSAKVNVAVSALLSPNAKYTTAIGHDGTYVVIAYICNDGSVRTRILTLATWGVGAEQIAWPATANLFPRVIDIDISSGGAILMGIKYYTNNANDKVGYILRIRPTSTTSWLALSKTTMHATATIKANVVDISVSWFRSTSATARRFTVLPSWGAAGSDQGVTHIHGSVNETDGSALSTKTITGINAYGKITYLSGDSFAKSPRKIRAVGLLNQPNHMAVGINYSGFYNNSTWTSVYIPHAAAGIIKITSAGVNAAGDTVELAGFTTSAMPECQSALQNGGVGVTFAYDGDGNPSFNFLSTVTVPVSPVAGTKVTALMVSRVLAISNPLTTPAVIMRRGGQWDNTSQAKTVILGFTALAWDNRRHDTMMQANATGFNVGITWAPNYAATAVKPAATSVVASSTPTVGGTTKIIQSLNKVPMDFYTKYTVATDAAFTAGVITFFGTRKTYSAWSSTSSVQSFEDKWTGAPIPSGSRYIRVNVVDVYGNDNTPFATSSPFAISHPGTATAVNPPYSATDPLSFPYSDPQNVGYSLHTVSWQFSDAWLDDYQTAYQIRLFRSSTDAVVYDTGKVASSEKTAQIRVPLANKNENLYFIVTVWDRYDQAATPLTSAYGALITYASSTVDSLVPHSVDGNGNVNSTAPQFNYTITDGLFETATLDAVITQGNRTIVAVSISDPGLSGRIIFPSSLENGQDYTVTATAVDTAGLRSSRSVQIRTQWTPPAAPSAVTTSLAYYNTENRGYVELAWTDASKDVDWVGWNIYRQIDQIDGFGAVVKEGKLEFLSTTNVDSATMTYADYTAPSGVRVGYVVRQLVNRLGAMVESINTEQVAALPLSDGYWLIDPTPEDPENTSFRLYSVTAESYTHKYESQTTHIIGRGNHEDRGDDLGREGSLTAQLRDSATGTARLKRMRIEEMKEEARSLYLRNPFGDVWPVSVGDISIERIAGTGLMEHVDLTIPYIEVYG